MSDGRQPVISLVVATIGETPHLARLARSLGAQEFRDFEVIVVNQGAERALDDFEAALPDWVALTKLRSARGLSRARNVGLKAARGRLVAFPDDDCWYPQHLLGHVASSFGAEEDLDILTCATRDAEGAHSNGTFLARSEPLTHRNVWKAGNSNGIFLRLAPALAVHGFDETLGAGSGSPFGSGEETDLLLRLIREGSRGRFDADLFVHHDQVDRTPDAGALRRARLYSTGYGRVLRLHRYTPAFAAYRAVRSVTAALLAGGRGHVREGQRRLIWAAGILRGYAAPLETATGSMRPDVFAASAGD
ncbi:glycosyltransferase family 2 protein [Silicimonas algicola]|uniref:Glycosyl transferase family 2 n=1 Tax=Silicimonas algicola TaxID=1826607 RepID=A0A316GE45_9RHOB|nr:glycosyltransferase family 2 protein [Silicimonas algicola]AZQ66505.1 glycosyltransferase family 2 protein [Silicimonas algicola]PWK58843.1 glycosyl transferase family 2 [Silicimonas algicola]